jgi:DNA invertase Pin-like site-specific DNA recombinase
MGSSVSIACSTTDTVVVSYRPLDLMIRQMETLAMLIGYARTSTTDQHAGFEAQLVELKAYGCERMYQEQVSAVASRGELDRAIDMLREGDKLVVTKLDRLARNVMHMGELLQQIESKGAGLVILSLGSETVDTSTATGKLILNMMVSVAQFEREMMKERQVEGIKRAQAEGKYKGRVPTAMKQANKVKALVDAGVTRVQVQEQLGISKASYYRCLKAS